MTANNHNPRGRFILSLSLSNLLSRDRRSFTLIELLVVVAILSILAVAVILTINPSEFLKQARDSTRLSDMANINSSLNLFVVDSPDASLGTASTTYISIPDPTATSTAGTQCQGLGLSELPSGWTYHCAATSTYRNTDGTGWVPVNFQSMSFGSTLGTLPIDPINTTTSGNYYMYSAGGSWELVSLMESNKYLVMTSNDGGDSIAYEKGTNLSLNPKLKTTNYFGDFPTTVSYDGSPRWVKVSGSGTVSLSSDSQGTYLEITNGQGWYEWQENIPFSPNALYKISCRVRQITDPTSGGKNIYCGVAGVASDRTTMININGSDSHTNQHYFAISSGSLTAGAGYTTFTGYFRGTGTPAGGIHTNINDPGKMYPGMAYFRPMFILNYNAGNGIANISMEIVEVTQ